MKTRRLNKIDDLASQVPIGPMGAGSSFGVKVPEQASNPDKPAHTNSVIKNAADEEEKDMLASNTPKKQASIIIPPAHQESFLYTMKQPDLSLQALQSKTAMSRLFEMNNIMQRLTESGNEEAPKRRSLLDSFLYNPNGSNSIQRNFLANKPPSFLRLFPSNFESGPNISMFLQPGLPLNIQQQPSAQGGFLAPNTSFLLGQPGQPQQQTSVFSNAFNGIGLAPGKDSILSMRPTNLHSLF